MSRWGVGVLVLCAVLAAPGRAVEPAKPPRVAPATASQPASAPSAKPEPLEHRAFRLTQSWIHAPIVLEAALRWDLDVWVFDRLLWLESRKQANPPHHPRTRARGISQFTRAGAAAVARLQRQRGLERTFSYARAADPAEAIPAAAELLAHLQSTCGGSLVRALGAYNTGLCSRGRLFAKRVLQLADRLRAEAGLPPRELERPRRRLAS